MEVTSPITGMQKLEALAALERTPARSKDIAKELGVSEILLFRWKTQFETGGELTDEVAAVAAPPTPPVVSAVPKPVWRPPPSARGRIYTEEQRSAAVAAYLAPPPGQRSLKGVAAQHDVNEKTLEFWAQKATGKLSPSRLPEYARQKVYTKNEQKRAAAQKEYAEDPTASIAKLAGKYKVSKSTAWEWLKDIRERTDAPVQAHAADVRDEAVRAYLNKEGSELEISKRFNISRTTLNRRIKIATGALPAPLRVGRSSPALDEHREKVLAEFFADETVNTRQLAHRHGLHEKTVRTWIRDRRIALGTYKPSTGQGSTHPLAFRYQVGKEMVDGLSANEAARRYNIPPRTAYDWREAVKAGRLTAPDAEPQPEPEDMPAHRKYSDETRAAVVSDVKGGMPINDVAAKYGVARGTFTKWPEVMALNEEKEVPPMTDDSPARRVFDKTFKYEIGKAILDKVIRPMDAMEKYGLVSSQVAAWKNAVRSGKLKPPRKKPGPKPNGQAHEIVEVHSQAPQQTQLALPPQMGRVTTYQEELARKDARIAELERKLRKAMSMVFDDD